MKNTILATMAEEDCMKYLMIAISSSYLISVESWNFNSIGNKKNVFWF